jgi:acyl dehydratase
MKFFEDIRVGEIAEIGRHTFTLEDIKTFAARFDPQSFHLDEAAAARSHFGRLCASGWHTACVWMRLLIDHHRGEDDKRRARGEPVAQLGPSPGFRDLQWLKPVYVGDTVSYASEVVEARALKSRRGWGIIFVRNSGVNQHGEAVISFTSSVFVECRDKGQQAP